MRKSWEEYDRCIQTAEEEQAAGAQWYGNYCDQYKPDTTVKVSRVGYTSVRSQQPQALINGEWVDVDDIRVTYIKMADNSPVIVSFVFPKTTTADKDRSEDSPAAKN